MKGMTDVIKPFLTNGGRVKLETILNYAMNCGRVDESDTDFRRETYKSNTVTILNASDFYSVGDGEYVYIDDMTDEEREQKAKEFLKLSATYQKTAGQICMNLETGGFIIPEPVKVEDGEKT